MTTHPAGKKYLNGKTVDKEEDTLYHYLARSNNVSQSFVAVDTLIDKEDFAAILRLKNKYGSTILHTAAYHGTLKQVFGIVEKKMGGLQYQKLWKAMQSRNKEKQSFIAAAVKANTDECETEVQKILIKLGQEKMRGMTTNFVYKTCDKGKNTLLHLAAKKGKVRMIEFLANRPVVGSELNSSGLNPLHIAVARGDVDAFEEIYENLKHRFDINALTGEQETVMHIAAKKGNVKMLHKLVELGADLTIRDKDGHTPLHDCLQQVHLEGGAELTERCDKFKLVWRKIVEVAVTWWCGPSFLAVPIPDEDSAMYQDFRRDALYLLRSMIKDNKKNSVLQYAAYLGLTPCVEVMLTEEHVFVRRIAPGNKDQLHATHNNDDTRTTDNDDDSRATDEDETEDTENEVKATEADPYAYEIEVTNLMPEFVTNINWPYKDDNVLEKIKKETGRFQGEKKSLVETLAQVKPALKATEILKCVPMDRLTKFEWKFYQLFSLLWFVLHLVLMSVCSHSSQTQIRDHVMEDDTQPEAVTSPPMNASVTNSTSAAQKQMQQSLSGRDNIPLDIALIFYAGALFVFLAVRPVWRSVKKFFIKKRESRNGPKQLKENPTYRIYNEYVEDKGAVMSLITYVVAFVVEQLTVLLPLCFFISAVVACAMFSSHASLSHYATAKGCFLLFGWLIVLLPLRAYSPIYMFLSTLKFIVIKDMLPFVIFYFFISLAFSSAIQLHFQLVTEAAVDEAEDASGFKGFFTLMTTVLYELMIMSTGMDTDLKHVQKVAEVFHADNQGSTWIETLLIVYGIISVIILLNMLIAMMGTTMSEVVQKHGTGWRQYQVGKT